LDDWAASRSVKLFVFGRKNRRRIPAWRSMGEQAEDRYAVLGSDVDLAVDDEWSDELVAVAEAVAAGRGLVTVVELVGEIGGVIGVEYGG